MFAFYFAGRPNAANVTSPSLSYHSDHYNITWAINSFSPIEQYRISYRKVIVSSTANALADPDWCSLTTYVDGGEKLMKPQQHESKGGGGGDLKAKLFYPEASGKRPLIRQNYFAVKYE